MALTGGVAMAASAPAGWGFDLAGRELAVKPGDDFFEHANGTYQKGLVIPPDRDRAGPRFDMSARIEARLRGLLEAAASSDAPPDSAEARVGRFYASFMDGDRIEALGARPLLVETKRIAEASDRAALAALMGRTQSSFQASLFTVVVDPDNRDPSHYAIYLGQHGLGLPTRDYYLTAEHAPARTAYRTYLAKLLGLSGWEDAERVAGEVLAFETALARVSWSPAERRDEDRSYNPMTPAALAERAPGFDWIGFLKAAGLADMPRLIVKERSAFPAIAALYGRTPLATLKAWQAARTGDNAAPYLSRDFSDAWFEFHGRTLSGRSAQPERWRRAVRAVSGGDMAGGERIDRFGNLGFLVGKLYTDRYFPAQTRARVSAIANNVRAALRARIEHLDWMESATRRQALLKLERYQVKVGYPDRPYDYAGAVIRRDDLFGNVERAAATLWAMQVARRHAPVDRTEWRNTPQMNNAYTGPLMDVVLTAGILQPPVFDPDADEAVNYGAIGAIVGHEFTHGFDDEGHKFDAMGRLRDWWTSGDRARFAARASRLGRQYAAFEPLPGLHIDPQLTMGENIADLGGVMLALDAYRRSLNGRPAPLIDGLSGEQRLFLGWAQAWRGVLRETALRRQVADDPHSPRRFRVNGPLRNMDSWYAAFRIDPDASLYVAPAERVRIW